jgi:hypothetical protein
VRRQTIPAKFIDREALAEHTGHPVRSAYKQPDEPDVLPPADAFLVAPAVNAEPARHPAFPAALASLRSWGVRVLFEPSPAPFPWEGLAGTAIQIRAELISRWERSRT